MLPAFGLAGCDQQTIDGYLDTIQNWVDTTATNADSIKDLPANIKQEIDDTRTKFDQTIKDIKTLTPFGWPPTSVQIDALLDLISLFLSLAAKYFPGIGDQIDWIKKLLGVVAYLLKLALHGERVKAMATDQARAYSDILAAQGDLRSDAEARIRGDYYKDQLDRKLATP